MIQIKDKTKCCGCTACYNVCPKNAIQMIPDEEGFSYPLVDNEVCIQCGLCNAVCPVENRQKSSSKMVKSVVLRTKNADILKNSTSGGFFSPLATWILKHDGIVCAATYDKEFKVIHTILEKNQENIDLSRVRGSKYVQSDLKDCFVKIKKYLDKGKYVCFVGTTCQVAGLKAFLRKDYKSLVAVDLVCHGTPSPKLWSKYLEYQKNKYNSEIKEISFRNKTYGYHSGTMKIEFDNGRIYYGSARVDYMLKSFFKEIASRPICYKCPFKTLERESDFTIYDCWHASELVSDLKDDDKGYTNVIIQSEKGDKVLEKISDEYDIYPVDTKKAVQMDGSMVLNSAKPHEKRREFYVGLAEEPLNKHIQKYIPITYKDFFIERAKVIIYRIGLYAILKRMIKKHN